MSQTLWARCVYEIDEEPVAPRNTGWSRLDPSEIGTAETEFGEDKSERPGSVRSGDNNRCLVVILIDDRVTNGENNEPSRVVVLVKNMVEKDIEAMRSTSAGRSKSGNGGVASFGHLADCAGSVVCRNRLDAEVKEHMLCLSERLGVGAHLTNVFDRSPRHTMKRMAYLHEVLGKDREPHVARIAWQPIEHRQHRSRRGVLDRNHQTIQLTCLERIECSSETAIPDELAIGEQFCCSPVAVAVRFSLISDLHGARP
jgi:hypothetical protein